MKKLLKLSFIFLALFSSVLVFGQQNQEKCNFEFYLGEGDYLIQQFNEGLNCEVACGVGCMVSDKTQKNIIHLLEVPRFITSLVGNWTWNVTSGGAFGKILSHEENLNAMRGFYQKTYSNFNMGKNPQLDEEDFVTSYKKELIKRGFKEENLSLNEFGPALHPEMKNKFKEVNALVAGLMAIGWMNLVHEKWVEFLYSSYKKMKENKCSIARLNQHCRWKDPKKNNDPEDQEKLDRRIKHVVEGVNFGDTKYSFKPNPDVIPQERGFKEFLSENDLGEFSPKIFQCGMKKVLIMRQ